MAESVPIRERIERKIAAVIAAISGIGTVERWDMAGSPTGDLSAVVSLDGEQAVEGGQGSTPITAVTATARIELLIAHSRSNTDGSAKIFNRWLAKIQAAMLADPYLTEATSPGVTTQLSLDVRYTGCEEPIAVEGQPEFFCVPLFEITYATYRDDPYQAPGITTLTE